MAWILSITIKFSLLFALSRYCYISSCVCFFLSVLYTLINTLIQTVYTFFRITVSLSIASFFFYLFSTLPLNTWLLCVYGVKRSFGEKTDNVSFKNNSKVFASDFFTLTLSLALSVSFAFLFSYLIAVISCFRYLLSSERSFNPRTFAYHFSCSLMFDIEMNEKLGQILQSQAHNFTHWIDDTRFRLWFLSGA